MGASTWLACAGLGAERVEDPIHGQQPPGQEPDILAELLALLPSYVANLTAEQVLHIEQRLRDNFGGQRTYIGKRARLKAPLVRQAGLTSAPTQQICEQYQISRATLYRHMKRGG
jgi:transcriptional regulator of acetoin/glycerol metabolism